jgi:curved DNA-binding protein CbpA
VQPLPSSYVYLVRYLFLCKNTSACIFDEFMDTFNDYYVVLGVDADASADKIKAAFKKLALQYHPDVYKGADAQERMRLLLLAYQTLSDPQERKSYDAHRSEHVLGVSSPRGYVYSEPSRSNKRRNEAEVSPAARRDRQRHYDFPDLRDELPARVDLDDIAYDLSPVEARTLREQGMLRGVAIEAQQSGEASPATDNNNNYPHFCHRCHHRWITYPPGRVSAFPHGKAQSDFCPVCGARDWGEYLLLRCLHCCAVFESEQIRYEVGSYNYGDGTLCPPYELFPLCPYCGSSGWCPAEDARVSTLRAQAARRAARLRVVLISVAVVVILVLGVVAINILR